MNAATSATPKFGHVIKRDDGRCLVVFERHLTHPVEKVWQTITDPDRLAQWFPEIKLDARLGGRFSIWFGEGCGDGPPHVDGEVTVFEPPRLLQMGSMRYELEPTEDGCLLRFSDVLDFTGERSNEDIAHAVLGGWHHFVDRLEAMVDGRPVKLDEPEPDYARREVPGWDLIASAPRQD